MKLFSFILFIICIGFNLSAQNEAISKFSDALSKYANDFPKSKTFIKTDKDVYAPGEKIWFNAEGYNCFTEKPTSESDLIVMLKAETSEIIVDNKYTIINGQVLHYITIPWWASEGNAYLIAHTPKTLKGNEATLCGVKPITINSLKKNDFILKATTDKKLYNPGEEIKLLINLKAITPSGKKEKVSISMFDNDNEIITQNEVVATNGNNLFKFKIPSKIENGLYFVIKTTGKSNICQKLPIYTTSDKIKVEFFVEGGEMLCNNIQRIVYRATDPFGKPTGISGKVFDKLNNQAGIGKILKNGVGLINLMPTLNQVYTLNIDSDYGNGQKFELPKVYSNGSAIVLMKTEEKSMQLTVNNSVNVVGQALSFVAVSKGEIRMTFDFTAEQKNNFKINTEQLPIGIINLMIINKKSEILSERLVYNIPNKDVNIDIQTHLKPLKTNGEVDVAIDMNNFINEFGMGRVDIKVIDTQNLYKKPNDLQYNYLEYPLYTATPKTVLDIFMTNIELIANEYRYFNYHDIINKENYDEIEKWKSLSGFVYDKYDNAVSNATVMLVRSNDPSLVTTTSDYKGHFVFDKISKSNDIVVKAFSKDGKKTYNVRLDRSFDVTLDEILLMESFVKKEYYDTENTPTYVNINENYLRLAGSENKDKKIKESLNSTLLLQSGTSILDVIRMIKPFDLLNGNEIVFYGGNNSINNQQGALIVIDGQKMGTSIAALNNVNPFEVISVNVSTNPNDIQKYTGLNTVGLIEIRTRGNIGTSSNCIDEKQEKDTSELSASFIQSDFTDKVWKYQTTLYWEPNASVNENGMIELKLKLSEIKSEFMVVVDVTTDNGITHQQTTTFSTITD